MEKNTLSITEIKKDYDRIYSTSGLRTNSAYYRWIIKLLRLEPSASILDVSCGEGILLRETAKLGKGIKTYGLDLSAMALERAKNNAVTSKIVLADGQKIPFRNNYFDYVTCLGSLEHYPDPDLGVSELLRVAKKDAKFLIVLPNSFGIDSLLEILRTGSSPPENFQIIERSAAKNEWVDFLGKNGLKVESVYGSNLWPELFKEGTYKIKSLPKYLKRKLIHWLCPLNFAREFVFVCHKK